MALGVVLLVSDNSYNFIQSVANLKARFLNLRENISGLYTVVSLAKISYAADLAFTLSNANNQAAQADCFSAWWPF